MKPIHLFLAIIPSFLTGCTKQKEQSSNPNIIIFHVDDLGWTDVGCYGSDYYETPNIDQLCKEGMKFTNAYAPGAISSPSRASMQTGKYAARLGITDWIRAEFQKDTGIDYNNPPAFDVNEGKKFKTPFNENHLPLTEKTIGEYFKQAGYMTSHLGKWHLGDKGHYPTDQGYDINIAGCDYGEPPSYFDPYFREARTYPWGHEPAFSFPTLDPRKKGEYLTNRLTDEAVRIIRQNKDTSFFMFYNFYAVHTPIQATDSLVKKYKKKPDGTYHDNPVYAAMIESVDHAVGRINRLLDELGLAKNTLIIFTSDNGGLTRVTSNHPLRAGKGNPYEGGIRVPLIVKWPNHVKQNVESDVPVTSMDVLPTLADILDIQVSNIDGHSFAPVLYGNTINFQRDLFWHYPHYRGNQSPYTIVRSDSMKLIRFYDGDSLQLFNLLQDISEQTDLSEKYPEVTQSLNQRIDAFLQRIDAKLPVKKDTVK